MNKITTYLLRLAAMLVLCPAFTSCQPDDFADDEGLLPPGHHPISFEASVGKMKSRSEGKNSWNDDDRIGLRTINLKGRKYSMLACYSVNEEGMMKDVVRRYSVGADESWIELDKEPLEWPYPNGRVSAWYPFEPRVDVAIDNQAEKGFDHLDFLSAITDEMNYKDVANLEFKHQMAKVTCRIIPGDGITAEEFESLWLRLQGHTSCTFRETQLTGGENIGWIIPDSTYSQVGSVYEALLVPNDMEQKDLISIRLNTNYEGNIIPKHFSYPSPKIEGGRHYVYNITVQKDRIEVSFLNVEWEDVREDQHEPTRFTFRVNLSDELINLINTSDTRSRANVINTNLVSLSENVTPILNDQTGLYDKFDVLGNEFTFSIAANKNTRSKRLVLAKNEAVNNPLVVNQTGPGNSDCYVENKVFLISDETTIDYEDNLNVGDYYFDDGSWSSIIGWKGVNCVGIVFAVNKSDDASVFKLTEGGYEADNADNYNFTDNKGKVNPIFTSRKIHGYVLALEDARRWDNLSVKKTLNQDATYQAGTLEYDTEVIVHANTLSYVSGKQYPAGTLPYDIQVVMGRDTTLYKKGTVYPQGTLTKSATVKVLPDTTVYAKGTNYTGGKLITKLTVTSLNVLTRIEAFPFSPFSGQGQYLGAVCSLSQDLFNGYANMVSVRRNEGMKLGSQPVPPFNKLEAFAAAEGYEDFLPAPQGTSGWYLPSIKQLEVALSYLYPYTTHTGDSPILKAGGLFPSGYYWSSTIASSGNLAGRTAFTYDFFNNKKSEGDIVIELRRPVRPVLTF